jgi:serine/threonine protein phosphatase PrpC
MQSAEQACERLLQLALDDGGSDNITIVIARAIKREQT